MKKYIVLLALILNLLPSLNDGKIELGTMSANAQVYLIESAQGSNGPWTCANINDPSDWFTTNLSDCGHFVATPTGTAAYCTCQTHRVEYLCLEDCSTCAGPSNNDEPDYPDYPDYPDNPPSGGGTNPGGGDDPPQEDDPCSGMKNGIMKGDPLTSMKILGTKNNGIPGGAFGDARGYDHTGIDLKGNIGDPVRATHSGTVIRVEDSCPVENSGKTWERYCTDNDLTTRQKSSLAPGRRVYIDCGGGLVVWYWHLNSTNVQFNQTVVAGDVIGTLGNSGNCRSNKSAGPHLHYQTRENNVNVNPTKYFYSDFNMQTGVGSGCN